MATILHHTEALKCVQSSILKYVNKYYEAIPCCVRRFVGLLYRTVAIIKCIRVQANSYAQK